MLCSMNLRKLENHYGIPGSKAIEKRKAVCKALKFNLSTVTRWDDRGFIPEDAQYRIQVRSHDRFLVDRKYWNP